MQWSLQDWLLWYSFGRSGLWGEWLLVVLWQQLLNISGYPIVVVLHSKQDCHIFCGFSRCRSKIAEFLQPILFTIDDLLGLCLRISGNLDSLGKKDVCDQSRWLFFFAKAFCLDTCVSKALASGNRHRNHWHISRFLESHVANRSDLCHSFCLPPNTSQWNHLHGCLHTNLYPCSSPPKDLGSPKNPSVTFAPISTLEEKELGPLRFKRIQFWPPPQPQNSLLRISVWNQVSNGHSYQGEPGKGKNCPLSVHFPGFSLP